jgi:hypothetical protein
MFIRNLMIVCMALSGSAAQAGLIVGSSVEQNLIQAEVSAETMTAWFELQQSHDPKSLYLHGQCDDMSAVNTTSITIGAVVGESSVGSSFIATPLLVWHFTLANSSLPLTPVLDGQIKPS